MIFTWIQVPEVPFLDSGCLKMEWFVQAFFIQLGFLQASVNSTRWHFESIPHKSYRICQSFLLLQPFVRIYVCLHELFQASWSDPAVGHIFFSFLVDFSKHVKWMQGGRFIITGWWLLHHIKINKYLPAEKLMLTLCLLQFLHLSFFFTHICNQAHRYTHSLKWKRRLLVNT